MPADLLIIVPTRGRPQAVRKVVDAWSATGAFDDGAAVVFVHDYDDPQADGYRAALDAVQHDGVRRLQVPHWQSLVPKLNEAAKLYEEHYPEFRYLGFAGDDHLPRTRGWAARYRQALADLGTGIVYCDDGLQGERLPTQWAMTADIVRTLGAMVPGETQHLYCDNIVKTLGQGAGCLAYLPDVLIEHMHPAAGKADVDAGYSRVNAPGQYAHDRQAYARWLTMQADSDVAAVRELREVSSGE